MTFFNLIEYYSRLTKFRLLLLSIFTSILWILVSIIAIAPELRITDKTTYSNEGIFKLSCFESSKGSRSAELEFNEKTLYISLNPNSPAQCYSNETKYLKNFIIIQNKSLFIKKTYFLDAEIYTWKNTKHSTIKSNQTIEAINVDLASTNKFMFIITTFLWLFGFLILFSSSKNFPEFHP